MHKMLACAAAILTIGLSGISTAQTPTSYSTGAVSNYPANPCGGPDLPLAVPEAESFRSWYYLAGLTNVSRWENNNVWGSDFRDGPNADLESQGGSDLPDVYFFSGHGICQSTPTTTDADFISVCSTNGQPNTTDIGASSRWGNSRGRLKFAFIDASCPMDLVSLGRNWFPAFQGLHIAVGHSGNIEHDTLDSIDRGDTFAGYTVSASYDAGGEIVQLFPEIPATWAWMNAGLIDVQSQVCAVSIANDATPESARNRRDNEYVRAPMGRPSGNWFAWRWVCN
jgi:hypothetical protein